MDGVMIVKKCRLVEEGGLRLVGWGKCRPNFFLISDQRN